MGTTPFISQLRPVGTSANVVDLSGGPISALPGGPVSIAIGSTSGIPTLPGDQILVTAFTNDANANLVLVGRGTNANGQTYVFSQTYPLQTAYFPASFLQPAPGGTLQSLAMYVQLSMPNMCWCYATAGLVNPASGMTTPYFNLIGDYISNQGGASYPGRGIVPPESVDALSYSVRSENFGAGNGWGVGVPDWVQWDVHWLAVQLVTSATALDRFLGAEAAIWAGSEQIESWQSTISTPIPANTTVVGVWDQGGSDYQNNGTLVRGLWPRHMYLHGNDGLGTVALPLDAGDVYEWATVNITERYTPNADLNPE